MRLRAFRGCITTIALCNIEVLVIIKVDKDINLSISTNTGSLEFLNYIVGHILVLVTNTDIILICVSHTEHPHNSVNPNLGNFESDSFKVVFNNYKGARREWVCTILTCSTSRFNSVEIPQVAFSWCLTGGWSLTGCGGVGCHNGWWSTGGGTR